VCDRRDADRHVDLASPAGAPGERFASVLIQGLAFYLAEAARKPQRHKSNRSTARRRSLSSRMS
jgi:hypothetical protein